METIKYIKGKIGYGIGAVGLDLSYGMFYSFLAKYLTDVLGLGNISLSWALPPLRPAPDRPSSLRSAYGFSKIPSAPAYYSPPWKTSVHSIPHDKR